MRFRAHLPPPDSPSPPEIPRAHGYSIDRFDYTGDVSFLISPKQRPSLLATPWLGFFGRVKVLDERAHCHEGFLLSSLRAVFSRP